MQHRYCPNRDQPIIDFQCRPPVRGDCLVPLAGRPAHRADIRRIAYHDRPDDDGAIRLLAGAYPDFLRTTLVVEGGRRELLSHVLSLRANYRPTALLIGAVPEQPFVLRGSDECR